jgi:hypothetical protein
VRSPLSFTNAKGKAEEARDRVFKFKGEPAELVRNETKKKEGPAFTSSFCRKIGFIS